jgi:hypothetical protein
MALEASVAPHVREQLALLETIATPPTPEIRAELPEASAPGSGRLKPSSQAAENPCGLNVS